MPEREEDIQLRSEEVQEILSHMPHWIIRWGITLIFGVIVLLLLGSWFIKYPEIITSRVTVSTAQPPVRLVAQSSGNLKLYVKDRQSVQADTYLAVVENAASFEDIQQLKTILDKSAALIDSPALAQKSVVLPALEVGELQTDYSVLIQAYKDYNFFISNNFYTSKISSIRNQYTYYTNLNEKLNAQSNLLNRELELAQKKYGNDQKLFADGVISQLEMSRSESEYLQKKYAQRSADISLVNNKIQLEEYTKTLLDLEQQYEESNRRLLTNLQESFQRMQASLKGWERRYAIISPIDGAVSFFKFYSDNQFVNAGEEIITIVPPSGKVTAKLMVPAMGIGKVLEGQKVNIKLDGYPYREFGVIEGRVESISSVTRDNLYLIQVSLPNGLTTTYHQQLDFKQEMGGNAEIITKDLRLIERIFNQLRGLLQQSS